ncbi:MAG TPA: hypothetical protein VGA69_10345, partial [Nitriliruptorales bacterium]
MSQGSREAGRRDGWTRRYPPLTGALVATLLAVFVLPSALNVPQSNPTQTLEFAPIPPTDEDQPPPATGNTSSLGLGSSSTAPGDGLGDGPGAAPDLPPPPVPEGEGARPVTKRCVGNPPRQTEDALAPPCVAHFEGDNGGATYQGVEGDEIRVVIYHDCCIYNLTSRGVEPDPPDTFFDLWEPPDVDEEKGGSVEARTLRAFQAYFNARYQLYGRTAHFTLRFASDPGIDPYSPEQRRADARDDLARFDPFAVITYVTSGNEDVYLEEMARAGVLVFGSNQGRDESFYQRYPGLIWGYRPSLQVQTDQFASWVCTKVVPHPVVANGNGQAGLPRKLGLVWADMEDEPSFGTFAKESKRKIEACGGTFAETLTFSEEGSASQSNAGTTDPATNMAAFQQAGVTTIVWPGGYETQHSRAGARIGYLPEWVVAGDRAHDGYGASAYQDQDAWQYAWTLTNELPGKPVGESECAEAMREGNPAIAREDLEQTCTFRQFYVELRQLFTGVQVAGPRLTPASIDQGFHAIPAVPSTDPSVPACFYEPG